MYAGLTTADKGALLDAKARGAEWVARDYEPRLFGYSKKPRKYKSRGKWIFGDADLSDQKLVVLDFRVLLWIDWSDPEPVNIDIALAQIEEMESKHNNLLSEKASEKGCLTMDERINQMTIEEKAKYLLFANAQDHAFKATPLEGKFCYIALDGGYYGSSDEAIEASEKFLHSPYTEGETK